MTYGSVQAVNDLDLVVQSGSITAVLGPNGAGKTTTLEVCEGFRRAQSGSVRVLGLNPLTDAKQLRPRVGVMLQSGGAWSGSRAAEMLHHIASLHAHSLDVETLMERVGLTPHRQTPYRRLSGGEQQRLSLAMAIVGRPELVFLDEPTAGLDPHARRETWALIRELQSSGVTVVLTTHFMDEAEALADQIHIVDAGQVIASGTVASLTTSQTASALRFTTATPIDVDSLGLALPVGTIVRETHPGEYVVSGSVRPDLLANFTTWCATHGVMPATMLVERRTLEDVFLDLTGKELQ